MFIGIFSDFQVVMVQIWPAARTVCAYLYAVAKFAFPSIYDRETVVLLLLFILVFWIGCSYLVTTGWIFEISLREKLSVVANGWVWNLSRMYVILMLPYLSIRVMGILFSSLWIMAVLRMLGKFLSWKETSKGFLWDPGVGCFQATFQ